MFIHIRLKDSFQQLLCLSPKEFTAPSFLDLSSLGIGFIFSCFLIESGLFSRIYLLTQKSKI